MIGAMEMVKQRLTPEQSTAAKRARLERDEARARQKVERQQRDADQATAGYRAELAHEESRSAERQFQEDGMDYLMGRDTEGARRFAAEVARREARVAAANARAAAAGNPLGIDGPALTPSAPIRRKLESKEMKAQGYKRLLVRAHDGSVQAVWHRATSFRALGFDDRQVAAADRFYRDWQIAYSGLKGQSFEMAVDGGGGGHDAHATRVAAQGRLGVVKRHIGEAHWQAIVAVVIHGATARAIHEIGGKEHRVVMDHIDKALNALDAAYTGGVKKDRTWQAFEQFNAERAALIEQAEREVG